MLTLEQVFVRVAEHLLAQGEPAIVADAHLGPHCRYLAPDGKRCAVGCLLAEDAYSEELESQGVCEPIVVAALGQSGVPTDALAIQLLEELQILHDDIEPEHWADCLRECGAGRGFALPACLEATS